MRQIIPKAYYQMAHDPVAYAALGQLRDILQGCLQVADVLGAAVDALQEQAGPPPQQLHESRANVERSRELQTVLGLQQRLSEVFGVATVTFEGSTDSGFRFLVEMPNRDAQASTSGL
jgi:hypothetical protein